MKITLGKPERFKLVRFYVNMMRYLYKSHRCICATFSHVWPPEMIASDLAIQKNAIFMLWQLLAIYVNCWILDKLTKVDLAVKIRGLYLMNYHNFSFISCSFVFGIFSKWVTRKNLISDIWIANVFGFPLKECMCSNLTVAIYKVEVIAIKVNFPMSEGNGVLQIG